MSSWIVLSKYCPIDCRGTLREGFYMRSNLIGGGATPLNRHNLHEYKGSTVVVHYFRRMHCKRVALCQSKSDSNSKTNDTAII